MRTPRIYYDGDLEEGNTITLSNEVTHHIKNVLRRKKGDALEVFNNAAKNYLGEIAALDNKSARVSLIEPVIKKTESPLFIELGLCLIKPDKMDFAIQKAVELGVNSIVPIISTRSNVSISKNRIDNKLRHWRSVIVSSCAQSERVKVPELSSPKKLVDWFSNTNGCDCIYFHPDSELKLKDIGLSQKNIKLLIGPEGGLTDLELRSLSKFKWHEVNLGKRILRSETAVIAALTLLQSAKGDM